MFLISCSLKDFCSLGSLCMKILTVFLAALTVTVPLYRYLRWIGDFRFNYIYIYTYVPCRNAFISRLVAGDISICVYEATLFCLTFFSQVYRQIMNNGQLCYVSSCMSLQTESLMGCFRLCWKTESHHFSLASSVASASGSNFFFSFCQLQLYSLNCGRNGSFSLSREVK